MGDLVQSAVMVLKHGDNVLMLLRRDTDRGFPGAWCFPGGKVEESDLAPIDAAIRELEEETGIDLPMELGVVPRGSLLASSPRCDYQMHVFSAVWPPERDLHLVVHSNIDAEDWSHAEHTGIALLPVATALRLPIGPATRAVLAQMAYAHRASIERLVPSELRYSWPLARTFPLLPDDAGRWGAIRKNDIHTGVDLYCEMGTEVVAMTSGTVVLVEPFTGAHVVNDPSHWWNDTWAVLVEGDQGDQEVITYGEITPCVELGQKVMEGQRIGVVAPILKKFGGRPNVMLHIERAVNGTRETYWWRSGRARPERLLDVTPLLDVAHGGVYDQFSTSTYDCKQFRDPNSDASEWDGKPSTKQVFFGFAS